MSAREPFVQSAKITAMMLAPNGARLMPSDHPAIPVTVEQTIDCAVQCKAIGVQALHAHVRNTHQQHVLDVEQYQALLNLATERLGKHFPVQITTEAYGHYQPEQQIALMKALKPEFASVAMREIWRGPKHDNPVTADTEQRARAFYHWALQENIGIQHILYGEQDLQQFEQLKQRDIIPADQNAVLMVVGRYTDAAFADVKENERVVKQLSRSGFHWMLCAFGETETQCLLDTAIAGGGVRIGFENSVQHTDGSIAKDNAERVQALSNALALHKVQRYDTDQLRQLLGAS